MSFTVVAALGVALLALAPIIAHLLQRGQTREREFPAARLVPAKQTTSQERRRLEDRSLLGIRIAMILGLALLGATPLVRCSRLSLARQSGGSVAFAIVLDDSLSMRAKVDEKDRSRFTAAVEGARSLLASAREGDAVAIVLAGHPARVSLGATTDLATATDAIERLRETDRSTDLGTAVELARASIRGLPQQDKRIVVLSDLGDAPLESGEPQVWTPLPALAEPRPDCGILRAVQESKRVRVTVVCEPAAAAANRQVALLATGDDGTTTEEPVGQTPLPTSAGERTVVVEHEETDAELSAVLTGSDANDADDRVPVVARASGLLVGVVADRALAAAATGGPTVIEQALSAMDPAPRLQPFPLVPRDPGELDEVAALIVDDPPGLSPEARRALSEWVRGGGVAMALLGPRSTSAQLASTLEPFARGGVTWESSKKLGVRASSVPWLGEEAESLRDLTRRGRARLDTAVMEGATIAGRWDDGSPFVLERALGRGVLLTFGVPASVEETDFALRPGFIAALDYVLSRARQRSSAATTPVGTPWSFADSETVHVEGPTGAVALTSVVDSQTRVAVPDRVGRYRIVRDGRSSQRVALPEAAEIVTRPAPPPTGSAELPGGAEQGRVDVSREVALLLLLLLVAELGVRAARRRARARQVPASSTG